MKYRMRLYGAENVAGAMLNARAGQMAVATRSDGRGPQAAKRVALAVKNFR
jgi:hypothetical protein